MAGVSEDMLIAAHGTFHTSHCITCKKLYTEKWMKGMFTHTKGMFTYTKGKDYEPIHKM